MGKLTFDFNIRGMGGLGCANYIPSGAREPYGLFEVDDAKRHVPMLDFRRAEGGNIPILQTAFMLVGLPRCARDV